MEIMSIKINGVDVSLQEAVDQILGQKIIDKAIDKIKGGLRKGMKKGCVCPACNQRVQMYPRKITSTMAYQLIRLSQYVEKGFVHIPEFLNGLKNVPAPIRALGDFAKLRFFDLIKSEPGERDDGSVRIGKWMITEIGTQFVEGKIKIPEKVFIYNNQVYPPGILGIDPKLIEQIDIHEALQNKFSYSELMNFQF